MKKLVLLVLLTTAVGTAHAQLIQPRTITNIEDLSRIGAEMPTNTETYDVYKVGGRYQIYYFQVSSFSTMLDYLGRVLLWSDLQTTQLKGLGDGVINQLDDYNHDGKLVEKDVLYAVLVIWGARGQAAGVTYDLAHTMKAFNAYLAAGRTLQVSMSRPEAGVDSHGPATQFFPRSGSEVGHSPRAESCSGFPRAAVPSGRSRNMENHVAGRAGCYQRAPRSYRTQCREL